MPRGYVNPEDLFSMSLDEFATTWNLTKPELLDELRSGRLVAVAPADEFAAGRRRLSRASVRLPMMRAWVARRDIPGPVRAKIDAAGSFGRLDAFRHDQITRCKVDFENNRLTLPDGTILHDVQVFPVRRQ